MQIESYKFCALARHTKATVFYYFGSIVWVNIIPYRPATFGIWGNIEPQQDAFQIFLTS